MPDFEAIYNRIHRECSKANLYYMWHRYKQAHPSGYQYIQFCHYFNQYVELVCAHRRSCTAFPKYITKTEHSLKITADI